MVNISGASGFFGTSVVERRTHCLTHAAHVAGSTSRGLDRLDMSTPTLTIRDVLANSTAAGSAGIVRDRHHHSLFPNPASGVWSYPAPSIHSVAAFAVFGCYCFFLARGNFTTYSKGDPVGAVSIYLHSPGSPAGFGDSAGSAICWLSILQGSLSST